MGERDAVGEACRDEGLDEVWWEGSACAVEGGHGEGCGAGEAAVPDHEAEVTGGGDDGVVVGDVAAGEALADFAGEYGADDEAESPVDDAGGAGGEADGGGGGVSGRGEVGEVGEESADWGRGGEDVAADEDEAHLHGEGEEGPDVRVGAGVAEGVGEAGALGGEGERGEGEPKSPKRRARRQVARRRRTEMTKGSGASARKARLMEAPRDAMRRWGCMGGDGSGK